MHILQPLFKNKTYLDIVENNYKIKLDDLTKITIKDFKLFFHYKNKETQETMYKLRVLQDTWDKEMVLNAETDEQTSVFYIIVMRQFFDLKEEFCHKDNIDFENQKKYDMDYLFLDQYLELKIHKNINTQIRDDLLKKKIKMYQK